MGRQKQGFRPTNTSWWDHSNTHVYGKHSLTGGWDARKECKEGGEKTNSRNSDTHNTFRSVEINCRSQGKNNNLE